MAQTGLKWFTRAFVQGTPRSGLPCTPQWDGRRAVQNTTERGLVEDIRAGGGDVMPSLGGASDDAAKNKTLEWLCRDPAAPASGDLLAAAYGKVIEAFAFKAIDIDIEGSSYADADTRKRTVDALLKVRAKYPAVKIFVTISSGQNGPPAAADSLINLAAARSLEPDGWAVMTFDFGGRGQNMALLTARAVDGLQAQLATAYRYTSDQAYRHAGLSSMNGKTDQGSVEPGQGELVTVADFEAILAYASQHHLARLTFWSLNRDRSCPPPSAEASPSPEFSARTFCSDVDQKPLDYASVFARYTG